MNFTQRLSGVQSRGDTLLSIGLDIDPLLVPPGLPAGTAGLLEFNRTIIDATSDLVCAYKVNLAFYEALGRDGWELLYRTRELIPPGVLAIADGKRGDIGNSSERYAHALLEELDFGAVTVNPYMGFDSVEPFLKDETRGVFLLALTSNPGSKDFQRLKVSTKPLFQKIVAAARRWNTRGNIGLVVGATHPRELKAIRKTASSMPILIPGVGRQGGDLKSAVVYGCTKSGRGAVIHAGRSVVYASRGSDYATAARAEAVNLRNRIRSFQRRR